MNPERILAITGNDKGGPGKSQVTAMLYEKLHTTATPWRLAEVERRDRYSQHLFGWSQPPLLINLHETVKGRDIPSHTPFTKLHSLIPEDPAESSRIIVDFGASAFVAFAIWAGQQGGIDPLTAAGFRLIYFVPIRVGDPESASFLEDERATLEGTGLLIPVWNHHHNPAVGPAQARASLDSDSLVIPWVGEPAVREINPADGSRRYTYSQLAGLSSASRRSRIDAAACDAVFTESLNLVRAKHKF